MINPQDVLTITALDLLLDEEVSADFSHLIMAIEGCATYGEIATSMDQWLEVNPAIEEKYNSILARLEPRKEAVDKFFQGIEENPQDPESVHRQTITLLTNKLRKRSVPKPPAPQPPQAYDRT